MSAKPTIRISHGAAPSAANGFREYSVVDLQVFYDAFVAAAEAIKGVMNQPRCDADANELLAVEVDRFYDLQEAVCSVLERQPLEPGTRDATLRILVDRQFRRGDVTGAAQVLASEIPTPSEKARRSRR